MNPAPLVGLIDGAVSMRDLDTYLELAKFREAEVNSKIVLLDPSSERPGLMFINANAHETHQGFLPRSEAPLRLPAAGAAG